jgi:hypothetical protein
VEEVVCRVLEPVDVPALLVVLEVAALLVEALLEEVGLTDDVGGRLVADEDVGRIVLDVPGLKDVVGNVGTPAHPVLEHRSPGLQYQLVQQTKPTGMQPAPHLTVPDLHSPGPGQALPRGQQRLSLVQYSSESQYALFP